MFIVIPLCVGFRSLLTLCQWLTSSEPDVLITEVLQDQGKKECHIFVCYLGDNIYPFYRKIHQNLINIQLHWCKGTLFYIISSTMISITSGFYSFNVTVYQLQIKHIDSIMSLVILHRIEVVKKKLGGKTKCT